jgi:hypothetical protein
MNGPIQDKLPTLNTPPTKLRLLGIGRMSDNYRVLLLSFNRMPTSLEMASTHEVVCTQWPRLDHHVHTDECWVPDSACDMGRNENHVMMVRPETSIDMAHSVAYSAFAQRHGGRGPETPVEEGWQDGYMTALLDIGRSRG